MNPFRHRRAAGFSLIELMVSIVVGLLALVFATRLFANSEQSKATTIGSSDAMQNGMQALFSIAQDGMQSGWGLNDNVVGGCDTVFSDDKGYVLPKVTRSDVGEITPMAAAVIESHGAESDTITFMSGSSPTATGSLGIAEVVAAGGSSLVVDKPAFTFRKDDVVLIAPNVGNGATPRCALMQLAADPVLVSGRDNLNLTSSSSTRFNRGSGIGQAYAANEARVFNLGPADTLAFKTWSVDKGFLQLRSTNLAGATKAPQTVIDNVVSLKAQYGFDTRAGAALKDGMVVGKWSASMENADNAGATGDPGDFQRIAALRVAVVARSKVPDKPYDASGKCKTTLEMPTVFKEESPEGVTAVPIQVNVQVAGDSIHWTCYRYRVFETFVPMRNMAWRPNPGKAS